MKTRLLSLALSLCLLALVPSIGAQSPATKPAPIVPAIDKSLFPS